MKKNMVVLNPSSGAAGGASKEDAIKKCFDEVQLKYEIILTKKNEDVGEVIRGRLKEGFDLVVAAGGDGTVSAVINGLMETKIPLSIIPLGTGNLLAKELHSDGNQDAVYVYETSFTRN
jgi:diacylglycerol kinase family enzyme